MGELDPLLINFLKLDGSNADQNIDIGAWDFITTGNVSGVNITSGADPGHTHTGASLSGIDISADTNLTVTSPITLTDDDLGFTDTAFVLIDGSHALTSDWDVGAYVLTGLNYISDAATGTSPYACTSTTLNTNLNADMLDGKHVGTSGNTVPLLDGVNDWTGTNRYKEDVTISGDTKDDEKDLLIRSIHKVGFVTWKGSTIQFFDEAANRGSIWYKDCAGGLGIDDLTGLHLKSATDITLNANDGAAAITLNGLTVWRDDVTIGLGKPGTGSERFLLYANDNNGYLNPSGWGIGALVHPVSFIYNDGQEDTDFIMKGDTNANLFTLDAGNNNITINAASVSAHYDLMLAGDGVLGLKETATPTADTNYGKIYCKDTNKIFFQDGAGVEHELAYV